MKGSSSSPKESKESKDAASEKKGGVEKFRDRDGIDKFLIRSPRGASVKVSLYGGQVLSWKTDRGEELLFTSTKAKVRPPHPVTGGIPVCFPQFGKGGLLEQHGFARNKMWAVDPDPPALRPQDSAGKNFVDLLLKPTEDDLKQWPHKYELRLRVTLSDDGNLGMIPRVRNLDTKPFKFSFAFHTYFFVSDISEVRVEGLETLHYLDNLFEREQFTEQGDSLVFESEIDRVYMDSNDPVAVRDHERKRTIHIRRQGLPDVAVWNPWDKKAKAMPDLGNDEYKSMLCVDAAIAEKPVTLDPGKEWTGRLDLIFVRGS